MREWNIPPISIYFSDTDRETTSPCRHRNCSENFTSEKCLHCLHEHSNIDIDAFLYDNTSLPLSPRTQTGSLMPDPQTTGWHPQNSMAILACLEPPPLAWNPLSSFYGSAVILLFEFHTPMSQTGNTIGVFFFSISTVSLFLRLKSLNLQWEKMSFKTSLNRSASQR